MKKILIACQYATNKGDRAIAEYLIFQLRKQEDVHVTLSTNRPELWESIRDERTDVIGMGFRDRSVGIKNAFVKKAVGKLNRDYYRKHIYPDLIQENSDHKKLLKQSAEYIKRIKEADLVIVTGGHHITSIRSRNALFDVTYDIGLISLYAKRYILWSQTIGPLEFSDPVAKDFFGRVLNGAEAVFIRDANSKTCLESLYPELTNVKTSYDSVFGFGSLEKLPFEKREKKVGISIFNGLKKAFDTFDAIAAMLDCLAEKGYAIEFFRMEHNDKEQQDIQAVIDKMKVKADVRVFPFKTSTLEHLQELEKCAMYIGYKTHSVIMSLTTATPLLGICYHRKTRDFMADYGLEQYAIDDEALTAEKGIALAEAVQRNAAEIHEAMCGCSARIAEIISNDLMNTI